MRLRQDAWKQIKIAAVARGTTAHDLMIEALNDWFTVTAQVGRCK